MLTDEAKALGVGFDGEKFVVQHGDQVYRYSALEHAMLYAKRQAEKGISVRYTGALNQEECTIAADNDEVQVQAARLKEDERRAAEELRLKIESLDALESAKIASHVTASFNATEILELLAFFESTAQLYDAVRASHAKLEPEYRKAILAWYADNTGLQSETLSQSAAVEEIVARAMKQGLSAICKSEVLSSHLGSHHKAGGVYGPGESGQIGKIEKGRSWREISAEGK